MVPSPRTIALVLAGSILLWCAPLRVTRAGARSQPARPILSTYGAQLAAGPIVFPDDFMPSIKTYGAVGDGVTDDTAAIQRALADGRQDASASYYGRPKALYFPPGTYLVSDTLAWNGCCVTLQGAGPSTSIIRLAPNANGFNNPAQPKALIVTPHGNESFHQNIWDIGISIGPNNPGAIGMTYGSNNSGSVHNANILSEDGKGASGIDLTETYAGPLLIKDVAIKGFDVGIDLKNAEYSETFEDITLDQQNVVGIRNVQQTICVRSLQSNNAVPAILNSTGFVLLLDADLRGGSAARSAIETDSTFYLRNVTSSGYAATLLDKSKPLAAPVKGTISEYLVGQARSTSGPATAASLKLSVSETPASPIDPLRRWAAFKPAWYGDTSSLQTVLNSGASTIYFPFAAYFSHAEARATVPDSVNRIVGFSSVVNGEPAGVNGGGIKLVVNSNSSTPLFIEEFGYGLKIEHRGSRPIVVKDAYVTYSSAPNAGNLFMEDVEAPAFAVQGNQHLWARQLNIEGNGTKLANQGGTVWVLGLKTEGHGTVVDTAQGGQSEILGSLIYPATGVPPTDIGFRSTNANVSYLYSESVYCSGCGYTIQIQETCSGKTSQVTSSNPSISFRMPLFVSNEGCGGVASNTAKKIHP
jgi:hypothetical protein